ncbi:MAG: hypothetical protein MUC29_13640 [Pyrinomonadaceae bacterium]|jgi:hypothetical protein|nr:hypothetical protein [Pyrinomonadaceae bacterium]
MIQTLEAVVNEAGKIELLTEIRLKKRQRALVTILDEEPKQELSEVLETSEDIKARKDRLFAAFKKAQEIGLFAEIENPTEWQRKLRDEWD